MATSNQETKEINYRGILHIHATSVTFPDGNPIGNDVVITWYVECGMWNHIRNSTRRSLNIHYKQQSNF